MSDLFDSHCHFDFSEFDTTRDQIWQQCQGVGITQLLIPGVEPAQWQLATAMAERYSGIVMASGLHPWWIDKAILPSNDVWLSVLQQSTCIAIGECGLDAAISCPMDKQLPVFERHLEMAASINMPVIIHVRQTHNETIRLLKKYQLKCGGVIHGFTGSTEIAQTYWDLGFYLGVGGSITYPRANKTRKAIQAMPIDALLLETDAPDMPLKGYQGQPNSPLQLPKIARALAELRGESIERIAKQTTQNSHALFRLGSDSG